MAVVRALSLTAWFKVPEQGMKRYEVLSRATAFLLKGSDGSGGRLFASRHVTHPFQYIDSYYADKHVQAWLQFVSESHMRYSVEVYENESLRPLAFVPVPFLPTAHPTRDVSCWSVDASRAVVSSLASKGIRVATLPLAATPAARGQPLCFEGYVNRLGEGASATGDNEKSALSTAFDWDGKSTAFPRFETVQEPTHTHGAVVTRTQAQVFASTESRLEMGMCGGPVFDANDKCVGVIEGIVPALLDTDGAGLSPEALRVRRAIGGCAVFVEPDALQQLILTT